MENIDKELYKQITEQLAQMAESDQQMRLSGSWNDEVDINNTKKLKEIVQKIGWPTISKVGPQGARDAWLLAQHADIDSEWQEECLMMMEENRDDVHLVNIAYLTDRVRKARGMAQIFGTQFWTINGKLKLYPTEDFENLDERRKEFDMEPFAEYERSMREIYSQEK